MSAEHEPSPQTPSVLTARSPERGGIVTEQEPVKSENKDAQHGLREFIDNPIGKATVIAAGLLAAAGATFGAVKMSEPGPASSQTVATGPATPGLEATPPESTSTPESKLTPQAFEIKAGQSSEALAQDITDKINAWTMAGTDTFFADYQAWELLPTSGGDDAAFAKFSQDYAQKQTDIIAPVLFGPNYESNGPLQTGINGLTTINAATLSDNYLSSGAFERSQTNDGFQIVAQDGSSRTLAIAFTEVDNAASIPRIAAAYQTNGVSDPNGLKGTMTVTVTDNGPSETITALSFTN